VLAERGTLRLTPDQERALEQAQARLDRAQQGAREELAPSTGPARPPPGPPVAGPGGPPGARGRPPQDARAESRAQARALQQELDELDTQAFMEAVESLPLALREKATAIASRHRERVFEVREKERDEGRR
jgi:hypothetical protein